MRGFNFLNQILLTVFDISNTFLSYHWSEHVSNGVNKLKYYNKICLKRQINLIKLVQGFQEELIPIFTKIEGSKTYLIIY